jgi:AcrR family transcriptional regulator
MASNGPETTAERDLDAKRERAAHLGPERRRPLILDAALKLFVVHGYNGTSMESIAAAAEITKPVVYDCFSGKQELFEALLRREERRLMDSVAAAFPTELDYTNIEGLVSNAFNALFSAASAAPDSWRVVFDSEHGSAPAVTRRVRRARSTVVSQIGSLIEPYLRSVGVERPERKAPVLAELLASVGEAGVRIQLAAPGEWKPDELAALLGRVVARGPAAA